MSPFLSERGEGGGEKASSTKHHLGKGEKEEISGLTAF